VGDAWGHFQLHELRDPAVGRSPSTICGYLDYFKNQILPRWKNTCLDDVKAVEVERWLRGLDLADGTKAKIRNHLSALFSHCTRHELYTRITRSRRYVRAQYDSEIRTSLPFGWPMVQTGHLGQTALIALSVAIVALYSRKNTRPGWIIAVGGDS